MVLIGPVRAEPKSGRDMYGVVAVTHDKTGRECLFDSMVYFGGLAGEPPQELAGACDIVLLVKRADEITAAEADKMCEDLIGRCHFKRVRTFQTERALADAMVEFFPGAKSERLHAAIHADPEFQYEALKARFPARSIPMSDMTRPEAWIRRCPNCGGDAKIVGGYNAIDYIRCDRCGYYGDHWEEDGIVFDISVPTKDGVRCVDEDAYRQRISQIKAIAQLDHFED